tara:strand:+ start:942 stop:1196 length:255 start_codon:yes stop_codon:yes gene_type:complete
MAEQTIDGVLCVGEINENTASIDHYEWYLGSGRSDHPENHLVLTWSYPMRRTYDNTLSFEWLVSEVKRKKSQVAKIVAVQKPKY